MAVSVTHAFVSAVADSDDTSLVRPSDWNAGHTVAGLGTAAEANTADLLARANHTGTQLAATISDFSTAADARVSAAIGVTVQAYDVDLAAWAGVTRAAGFDTFVATPSSDNLRSLLTDETGTGAAVFATSPTLVTPALGTPSALVLTNATGLPNSSVIGLGTAALKNTGTSGDAVPLLNVANTWSQPITVVTTNGFPLDVQYTGVNGIAQITYRNVPAAGSGANNDGIDWAFNFEDNAGNQYQAAIVRFVQTDATNGSEDTESQWYTVTAGAALALQMRLGDGMQLGAPTGGYKGIGALNATAIYDDNVQITAEGNAKCWVCGTPNSTTIKASFNVTSLGDTATGQQTVTIATDFSSANYAVCVTIGDNSTTLVGSATVASKAAGSYVMNSVVEAGGGLDPSLDWNSVAFGAQ